VQGLHPVLFRAGEPVSPEHGADTAERISALREKARRPGRYRLEVDGRAVVTVDAAIIAEFKLRIGASFTSDVAARVRQAAARLEALDRALNALSTRARGSRELEQWLCKKGLPAEAISDAVARLAERGLIDDGAFARGFARARAVNRGQSRRRIEAELSRRGIARDVAAAAVREVFAAEAIDELVQAEAAAATKLRSLASLDLQVRRRRLFGFLARRGYSSEIISKLVRKLVG